MPKTAACGRAASFNTQREPTPSELNARESAKHLERCPPPIFGPAFVIKRDFMKYV
ncbi:MAG: hypothetical protein LBS35_09390 [Synergistaceae bacterium]|nr:hypothetical protein [Synergistaceae bacterium]